MRTDPRIQLGFVLLASALFACSGDGGARAQHFFSSACKKEQLAQSATSFSPGLQVLGDVSGLDGLRCVAWERVGTNELKLDLYNYENACGATWSGTAASRPDGSLALGIANPSCTIAKCGNCLYDWSFDVGVSTSTTVPTPITVEVDACPGQQPATTYPLATIGPEASGIRCAFADYSAISQQAAAAGTCGKAGWPCTGSLFCGTGTSTSTGSCDPGLVCDSSAAENEPRCLVPCTTVAECPRADAWSCVSGLCRPAT